MTEETHVPGPPQVHHLEDLGYVVWARLGEMNDCYVDVKVYTLLWKDDGGAYAYQRDKAVSSPDPVATLDEAEVFLSGSVKWDGCSNLTFDRQDMGMLHFCGKKHAMQIGELLGKIYDIAYHVLPRPLDDTWGE